MRREIDDEAREMVAGGRCKTLTRKTRATSIHSFLENPYSQIVRVLLYLGRKLSTFFGNMVKNNKTGLGRALVKKHNHMVQLVKEKGRLQCNKVLESITEVTDIETVIENAEEAELLFDADHPIPNLTFVFLACSWPQWNVNMSHEKLDINEKQAFLV